MVEFENYINIILFLLEIELYELPSYSSAPASIGGTTVPTSAPKSSPTTVPVKFVEEKNKK